MAKDLITPCRCTTHGAARHLHAWPAFPDTAALRQLSSRGPSASSRTSMTDARADPVGLRRGMPGPRHGRAGRRLQASARDVHGGAHPAPPRMARRVPGGSTQRRVDSRTSRLRRAWGFHRARTAEREVGERVPESSAEATVALDDLHAIERWLDREGRREPGGPRTLGGLDRAA